MNKMKIFENSEFGTIRTVCDECGNPWFCLKDVCDVLALRSYKVAHRLRDDQLSKLVVLDSLGRRQKVNFVNEAGMYDSILDSRKPKAREFRLWVTAEVLPAIRNRTYWEEKKVGRLFTSTYLVWTERGRRFIHQLIKGVA